MLRWMSGMSANHCPFRTFFKFWKQPKVAETKPCEKRGWSIFEIDFLARNPQTLNSSCTGTTSWRKITLSRQSSVIFFRIYPRTLLVLLISHPILDLSAPKSYFVHICIWPLYSLIAVSWVILQFFSPFLELDYFI
jgi:hypothetical protein